MTTKIITTDFFHALKKEGRKLFIYGTGGFGREVLFYITEFIKDINLSSVVAFLQDDPIDRHIIMDVPVYNLQDVTLKGNYVLLAIGNGEVRAKLANALGKSVQYPILIHPKTTISPWTSIGEGTIITPGCILTTQIDIGKHNHLNLNTTIGHDCTLDDYVTTAPNVNISGNCHLEKGVYLGTNSILKQGVSITKNTTVGMGSVVVKSISKTGTYVGIPAKLLA